jgi:hypothetical protein
MTININVAYDKLNKFWKVLDYKGKALSKEDVRKCLIIGLSKGYSSTEQITNEDIERALNPSTPNIFLKVGDSVETGCYVGYGNTYHWSGRVIKADSSGFDLILANGEVLYNPWKLTYKEDYYLVLNKK